MLLAAHPTRGIDVGAQAADLGRTPRRPATAGLGVLLISADLDELIGLSDTIVVIFDGRIVATLDPAEVTPELLGSYMTGARRRGRREEPSAMAGGSPSSAAARSLALVIAFAICGVVLLR